MTRWLRPILTVGLNALLCAVLIEAALRLFPSIVPATLLIHFEPVLRSKLASGRFPRAEDAIVFERDDGGFPFSIWKPFAEINYGYRDPGTVNTVKMDELGFCNPPDFYSRQKTFDAIAVGDSFTWCTTVHPKDTWAAQLGEQTGAPVYNLGKPAIGLYEYLQLLKTFGLPKHPRVVILNIYEGNDLRDALKFHAYRASGSLAGQPTIVARGEDVSLLSRHSYTWNLLGAFATQSQPEAVNPTDYSTSGKNFRYVLNFETNPVPFNVENGDLDEVVHAKRLADGELDLHVFDEALEKFSHLAAGHRFKPIVTYTPSAHTA